MSDTIRTRTVPHPTIPGRSYVIRHVFDPHSRPDDDGPDRYAGVEESERKRYERQDARLLASWKADRWHYIGVCVEVRQQTATNWADGGLEVGRASLWRIEDMGTKRSDTYIASVERDLMAEADGEVERLATILCGQPV
jgi:hypothetical protein